MCGGWNPLRNLVESVGSLAGNYLLPGSSLLTDKLVSKGSQAQLSSPLGQIGQIGTGLAGSGALGAGLQSAGGAAEQAGLSNLFNSIGSGLSSLGETTGLSGVGDNISNGLSNFSDSSGLSQLFGGTAAPETELSNAYSGITSAAPDASTAASATSPVDFAPGGASASYLPSGGTGGAALGGGNPAAVAGIEAPDAASALPSSTGAISPGTQNLVDSFSAQQATAPIGAPVQQQGALSSLFNGSNAVGNDALSPSVIAADNAATPGGIDASITQPNIIQSTLGSNVPQAGAGTMGTIGNSSGNMSALNGLLRGGLGYLLNNNNNSGYNAQINAGQQIENQYAPYTATGTAANNELAALYGLNGNGEQAAAQANWENTPGYQFALDQGLKAVNADAAAKGQTLSGNNQQAIQKYGTGLANQYYNNYLQNLQQEAGQGVNAAGGVATGLAGIGNAQAGKSGAAASNQNSAIAQGLNGLFPQGINLTQLLSRAGANDNGNSGILNYLFG